MTSVQLITFGNHIRNNTNQTVIDALASGNHSIIAAWYNEQADPAFWIFVDHVTTDEVRASLDWNEVLHDTNGLTDLQRWGFETLMHNGSYEPAKLNDRNALIKIFPTSMSNTRTAVLADATKQATNIEEVFAEEASGPAGGDGSSQGNSAIATFIGTVSHIDVFNALTATE